MNCRPPPYQGGALPLSYGSIWSRSLARRDGGSFAIAPISTQGQKAPKSPTIGNTISLRPMSKSEQAAQKEQRLAAKLRENLRRRKNQIKARLNSEEQSPGEPSDPQADTVNKP